MRHGRKRGDEGKADRDRVGEKPIEIREGRHHEGEQENPFLSCGFGVGIEVEKEGNIPDQSHNPSPWIEKINGGENGINLIGNLFFLGYFNQDCNQNQSGNEAADRIVLKQRIHEAIRKILTSKQAIPFDRFDNIIYDALTVHIYGNRTGDRAKDFREDKLKEVLVD